MMEVKIKKDNGKEIEFEVIGEKTLLNPLKNRLLEYEEVEFAEWKLNIHLFQIQNFISGLKKEMQKIF